MGQAGSYTGLHVVVLVIGQVVFQLGWVGLAQLGLLDWIRLD